MTFKLALLCCLLLAPAYAADSPAYRYSRPVTHQDDGKQSLLAVSLDDAVYANSANGFKDLRLVDQNGVETPYLLQKLAARKTVIKRLPSHSTAQVLQKTGNDGISITINLDKDAANADGFSVVTDQHDFEYTLQIQGSEDGQTWQVLVDKAGIYDYSRYMAIGNRDIAMPANNYRHFKIIVAKATQTHSAELLELTRTLRGEKELQRSEKTDLYRQPMHIERIEFWHNQAETLPEAEQSFDYPLAGFKVTQDAEHKTSLIDISTQRQPLTGFKLKATDPNFNRSADVQIPTQHGVETRMQTIGSATLEALHFQDINREQTAINFPEQRRAHYQIMIRNQDNPPLTIAGVSGLGPRYQLLFLAQPGLAYQLKYGSEQTEMPRYDTAPIQELLKRGYQTNEAGLAPEITATPVPESFDIGKLLNSKLFLGAAIALMVLVLGWSLFRVGKRLGDMSDSDKQE